MDFVTSLFRDGGLFMYAVALTALLGAVGGAALATASARGRWLPAAAWLVLPALAVALGGVGTCIEAEMANRALASEAPQELELLAAAGWVVAQYPRVFGLFAAAFLLGASALLGGIAHTIGAGPGGRWTRGAGAPTLVLALLAGLGLGVWAMRMDAGSMPVWVAATAGLVMLGSGLVSMRVPAGDDGPVRAAANRALVALAGVAAVLSIGVAGRISSEIGVYRALLGVWTVVPGEAFARMVAGAHAAEQTALIGRVAAGVVLVVGSIPLLPLFGRLRYRRTALSALLSAALLVPLPGLWSVTEARLAEVAWWTRVALFDVLQGRVATLPTDRMPEGMEPVYSVQDPTRPLLVFGPEGWRTLHKRTGEAGPIDLPLAASLSPTLIVPADTPARALLSRQIAYSGEAWLMTRSHRSKPVSGELDPMRAGVGIVALRLVSSGRAPSPESLVLIEDPAVSTDEAALALVRRLETRRWTDVRLVPGEGWTVQDIASLCRVSASVRFLDTSRSFGCALAAAAPADAAAPEEGNDRTGFGDGEPDGESDDGSGGGPDGEPGGGLDGEPDGEPEDALGGDPGRVERPSWPSGVDPQTSLGEPALRGSLDAGAVDGVVRARLDRLSTCWHREIPREPTLAGDLRVEFVIAADGTVSSAKTVPAATTLDDEAVQRCLGTRLLRMGFDPAEGSTTVTYDFSFTLR